MDHAMDYEYFVRFAFNHWFQSNPSMEFGRGGDPARLADADWFRYEHLDDVKLATGYSMHIYLREIINKPKSESEREIKRLKDYPSQVLNAKSVDDIRSIIAEFKTTVIERYYLPGSNGLELKR